ncbi:MAG: hypothetical protein ACLT8E_00175 [Akkermansia sp.]
MAPATCFLHLHAHSSTPFHPRQGTGTLHGAGPFHPLRRQIQFDQDTTGATSSINTSPTRGRKPSSALP